ncbi:MAG: hypothetical protein NUV42_00170 [Candidatus Yonathbacteria bacterium]|nr:hypothetical protein [Candidatus Yonathbacteria bacterium]
MSKKYSKNVRTVIDILKDEINGDVKSALKKMTKDYTMTWVYQKKNGELFPSTKNDLDTELEEVYPIKGREYDIKNIAEGDNVVMVEMVESYSDPDTKKIYRTPLVIVLEMKNGKIRTGRHYCDPKLSYLHLTKRQTEKAYKNSKGSAAVLK